MKSVWIGFSLFAISCALNVGCPQEQDPNPNPPVEEQRGYTPRWAFRPWISKDISDAADTWDFVNGMEQYDIPVGTLVIDSPWETNYNTFIVNEARYPGFANMVQDLRERDIRTVLWVTQMVNESSFDLETGGDTYEGAASNFQEGLERDYYVNRGKTYFWWKGSGAGVDFFNPEASAWWRAQQDDLFDMGIAGWKLDFGEEYLRDVELQDADGTYYLETAEGTQTLQAYSEKYYEDFYEYGLEKMGKEEFVIFARPWDESYGFPGRTFARPEHLITGWVGDQETTWEGLQDGLDHLFRSAELGYVAIGGDVGGYLDNQLGVPIPFDVVLFNRWVAAYGLMPIFQLHGRQNTVPWNVPERVDETIENYRYWATLHDQLVPYFYSLAEHCYAEGATMLRPVGDESQWPNDFRFMIGDAFFVAPYLTAAGERDILFPEGRFIDWFADEAEPILGPTTVSGYTASSLREIPLFLKAGAIVPMRVDSSVTHILPESHAGEGFTILVVPSSDPHFFTLEAEDESVTIEVEEAEQEIVIGLGVHSEPILLKVYSAGQVQSVTESDVALLELSPFQEKTDGYWVDGDVLWVYLTASTTEERIRVVRAD